MAGIPAESAQQLASGTLVLSVASFEEAYASTKGARDGDADLREAVVIRQLLCDLVLGNYINFVAMHALVYANRQRGWAWVPTTREEIEHVGEMASLFFLNPLYHLTPEQQVNEQAVLSNGRQKGSGQAVAAIIRTARWDVAKTVLCGAMDLLSRNLMEVWTGPEAHERLVYQTLMLSLRTDNDMGALLLHQLAMAHQQRGWDWRPSPDERHAIAETAAQYLVEKRYNAAQCLSP
jgi:hypothetical protein